MRAGDNNLLRPSRGVSIAWRNIWKRLVVSAAGQVTDRTRPIRGPRRTTPAVCSSRRRRRWSSSLCRHVGTHAAAPPRSSRPARRVLDVLADDGVSVNFFAQSMRLRRPGCRGSLADSMPRNAGPARGNALHEDLWWRRRSGIMVDVISMSTGALDAGHSSSDPIGHFGVTSEGPREQ